MKYTKPTVELIASAADAIQSSAKNQQPPIDGGDLVRSTPAYEADE